MTEAERVTRASNAKRALDEFLEPAFAEVTRAYAARLVDISSREPWSHGKIVALANAQRIAEEVRNQITALVADGVDAQNGIARAKRVENMSPAKRRLLNIGAY